MTDPAEAAKRVREGFLPLIRGMEGFVAYYWVDAGGGVMLSTSVFESEAAAKESNRKAAEWVKLNLASVLPEAPQIAAGHVVADAGSEPPGAGRATGSPGREAEASRH